METVWWIDFHEKMDVFRHTLQFEDCDTRWSTHVLNNLLKAYITLPRSFRRYFGHHTT